MQNDILVDKDALIKELYFLPDGEGYWIFEKWTKGIIYHHSGVKYLYKIVDDKLFLEVYSDDNNYEITLVFSKSDSKKYTKEEIKKKDNLDVQFKLDKKVVGFWKATDFIPFNEKNTYTPKECEEELFLSSLSLNPNGEALLENKDGKISKHSWTKNSILNKYNLTNSNYIIKNVNDDVYLIMDWKSGDYIFSGQILGCYVFKKNKIAT